MPAMSGMTQNAQYPMANVLQAMKSMFDENSPNNIKHDADNYLRFWQESDIAWNQANMILQDTSLSPAVI
jgi:hypothetical protein